MKTKFNDALHELAHDFVRVAGLSPVEVGAIHVLLIQVHNAALDEAQRVIGNEHPNTFDHLKYPPP